MVEKRKLAKNISNKTQIITKSGKGISITAGEVVAADIVTNGKGVLYDGFEFFAEVSVYSPKPLQRNLKRGEMKVPFDGFLKEKTTKGMGEKAKKVVKKAAKKSSKKVAKKAVKRTSKKAPKKKAKK